jgi:hypothetical protein
VSIGISGRSGPSVSSTSVNHSSFVNCGGMSFISFTRIDAVPVPRKKKHVRAVTLLHIVRNIVHPGERLKYAKR